MDSEDSATVLEPVDSCTVFSELNWVLDLHKRAKLRLVVLQVVAASTYDISFDEGMNTTHAHILDI